MQMEKEKKIKKEKQEEHKPKLTKKVTVAKNKKKKQDTDTDKDKPKVPLTKKQELNDYCIIRMRKAVAQTKVQLISKLVREVKKLENRKPGKSDNQSKNDKVVEKAKRKADRMLEEINFIKHVNKDDVSKYALLNKKTLTEVLQDPKSTLETRCLARFAPWKLIRTEVEKYRTNNPNWELQIPLLLVTGKSKRKIQDKKIAQHTAEEKELLKDFNQERKITTKGKPNANTNTIDKSDKNIEELLKFKSDSEDSDESEDEKQEIESDSDSEDSEKEEIGSEPESEQQSSDFDSETEEKEEIVKQVSKDKLINKKGKIEKAPKQMLNKSEGAVKVKFLKSLDDLEDDGEEKLPENISNRKEEHNGNNKRPKSSFFVGGTEEPDEPEEFKSQHTKYTDNLNRKERRGNQAPIYKKGKLINKPQQNNRHQQHFNNKNDNRSSTFQQHSRDSRYFDAPQKKGEFQEKSQRFNANKEKFNDYNNSNKSLQAQAPLKSSSKLHPSWEAKKKLNISTTEFQGKKIKFSQD